MTIGGQAEKALEICCEFTKNAPPCPEPALIPLRITTLTEI